MTLKMLIIGESGVGKSCLLLRFADDTYTESYISTIGVDFKIRTISVNDTEVKLQIWDTGGQERFRTITSAFYRGTHGVVIAYDTTDLESFDNVAQWLEETMRYAKDNVAIVIAGTKADLVDKRKVPTDTVHKFVTAKGLQWIETSAKTGYNVEELFRLTAIEMLRTLPVLPLTSASHLFRGDGSNC